MLDKGGVNKQNLLLKKNALDKRYKVLAKHREQQQMGDIINSSGIVSPMKLMIILCLIILSISTLQRSSNSHWPHVKSLTNYFSYYVLQQDDLSIYDRGDNLDQTYIQLTNFTQMQEHLHTLVLMVQNYTENGFVVFTNKKQQKVDMQYYYINGSLVKKYVSFQEFKQIILKTDLRELLLELRVLYFQIQFGDDRVVDQFKLVFDYQVYSYSMLRLDMSSKYKMKVYQGNFRESFILRNLERLFALVLIIVYSIQARKLFYNDKLDKQFRKSSLYWCLSLSLLNLICILSTALAPTCSILQLLPILQNYDSSSTLTYNFNVNLRYAIPIVFRIIIPVYTILTGFILYSMLMYPGEYFDDFVTGFFSYFYNNFQYGIYQIFIQIKSRGNVAYLLYGILYFYMVLVGSNLIPAFFCTLIYQKIAEQDLVSYVQNRLELVICPCCMKQSYQKYNFGLQININSPKSPYLKSGTKLKHRHDNNQKIAKMYIEQDDNMEIHSPMLSPMDHMKSKHKKAKELVKELEDNVEEGTKDGDYQWVEERIRMIQEVLGKL